MKKEQVKVGMVLKWVSSYRKVMKISGDRVAIDYNGYHFWVEPKDLRPLTARERGDTQ